MQSKIQKSFFAKILKGIEFPPSDSFFCENFSNYILHVKDQQNNLTKDWLSLLP